MKTIEELAREATRAGGLYGPGIAYDPWLERFAALVRSAAMEEALAAINALIVPGKIGGNGWDQTAQRNGCILAANALTSLIAQS